MKTLIGGAIAFVIGIIGITIWYKEFFQILAGSIPLMLLLGGGLAIYLGFDELKDSIKKESSFDTSVSTSTEDTSETDTEK